MQFSCLNLLLLLTSTSLLPGILGNSSTDGTNTGILKRKDDKDKDKSAPKFWDNFTPKPEDIKQHKNNDWFLCNLASLSNIQEKGEGIDNNIKNHIINSNDRNSSKELKMDQSWITEIEIYNIEKSKWESQLIDLQDSIKGNKTSNMKKNGNADSNKIWWPSAFEAVAQLVQGNEYMKNHEFAKDVRAHIGLKMLTGFKTETIELGGLVKDDDTFTKNLWSSLVNSNKSPMCIKKDGKWYSLLNADDNSKDITLYNLKKGEKENTTFDKLKKDLTSYSRIQKDDDPFLKNDGK
ncbi:uncharacterized protein L201_003413 [Kwoniella dendrophila CBS 6074]|uniref:Calpain catalytic domain-containing protein n=1 Tax=Kwoniella dendrophila CBS 6074 TaxID=1295534 RepID=A0AAX4JSV8_9TREE